MVICSRRNEHLAYRTLQRVEIKDWRLGSMYYIGVICIIVYIVFYVLLYNQGFRKPITASGNVVVSIHRGALPRTSNESIKKICTTNVTTTRAFLDSFYAAAGGGGFAQQKARGDKSGPSEGPGNSSPQIGGPSNFGNAPEHVSWNILDRDGDRLKLPCFFAPTDLVVRSIPPSSLFVATRRNITLHSWANGSGGDQNWRCKPTDSPHCLPESALVGSMYAGFSTFQLFTINHLVHSSHGFFTGDAQQFPGGFHWRDASPETTFGQATNARESLDKGMTLGDLLYLAGEHGPWRDSENHFQPSRQQRDEGGILAITIMYQNGHNCGRFFCRPWQDTPRWTMSVIKLNDGYEFTDQPQAHGPDEQKNSFSPAYHTQIDSGWLIMTMQEFEVGTFDAATMLLNVTASLTLMASVTLVLDLIAMYCLPMREHYRACMVMCSKDFDILRDKSSHPATLTWTSTGIDVDDAKATHASSASEAPSTCDTHLDDPRHSTARDDLKLGLRTSDANPQQTGCSDAQEEPVATNKSMTS